MRNEDTKHKRSHKAPGRSDRVGLSVFELFEMFPDEDSARQWFEQVRWPGKRCCPKCGSLSVRNASHKTMPYWCSDCRSYFSVRTGTPMQDSKLPLRKWVVGMYLMATSLKGVSSMKLHRDLGITQKSAWFMAQRIREAWNLEGGDPFSGPVEVDETYVGGKESNKHASKRLNAGRGAVGKTAVAGVKDRETKRVHAEVVADTTSESLVGMIEGKVVNGATVYSDEHRSYGPLSRHGYDHEAVAHGVGEYVNGQAHTNGMESFWSMLKRGYVGTYHKLSVKHLDRYVSEFAGRHNQRDLDTLRQMAAMAAGMNGRVLTYKELTGEAGNYA